MWTSIRQFKLAERHFAGIPSGPQPDPADIDELPQNRGAPRRCGRKFGTPSPALPIGYQAAAPPHAPEMARGRQCWTGLCTGGRAGTRVFAAWFLEQQIAGGTLRVAFIIPVGDLFDYNGADPHGDAALPSQSPSIRPTRQSAAYDEVIDEMKEKGIHVGRTRVPSRVKFPVRIYFFHARRRPRPLSIPALWINAFARMFSRCLTNDPQLVQLDSRRLYGTSPPEAVQIPFAHKMLTAPQSLHRDFASRRRKKGGGMMASAPAFGKINPASSCAFLPSRAGTVIWPPRAARTYAFRNGPRSRARGNRTAIPKFTGAALFFEAGNAVYGPGDGTRSLPT